MSGKDHDETGEEREPFLARWSKRKIDNSKQSPTDGVPPLPAVARTDADAEKPFDPQAFELPIPDLDDIVAGFDMRPFLQKGVPESLKNAALRKLWVTDPAIAGFVSPALDYAHDYNTPGAAPGFGPLIGDHDLTSLMENFFSRDPKDKPPQEPQLIQQTPPAPQVETVPAAIPPHASALAEGHTPDPVPVVQTDQPATITTAPTPAKPRHGSALPD